MDTRRLIWGMSDKTAVTEPKGPVYLCFDVPLQEDPLPSKMPQIDAQRVPVPTRIAPDATALAQVADLLVQAENPVVMAEYVGRNHEAVPYLTMLAELLALPVVDHHGRLNLSTTHPVNLTGSNLRESADLILALDVSDLYGALTRRDPQTRRSTYVTPSGCKIIEIGLGDLGMKPWSQGFQRFQETDLSILADTSLALPQLLELCQARVHNNTSLQTRFKRRAEALGKLRHSLLASWQEQAQSGWDKRPIATARLAHEMWEAIKGEDWTHAGSNLNNWMWRLWEVTDPAQHNGSSLGTSTQTGTSLGVALAHKDDGKLVVAIQPDGDLMYDLGVLWTAIHDGIPMLIWSCTTTGPTTTTGTIRSSLPSIGARRPRTPISEWRSPTRVLTSLPWPSPSGGMPKGPSTTPRRCSRPSSGPSR